MILLDIESARQSALTAYAKLYARRARRALIRLRCRLFGHVYRGTGGAACARSPDDHCSLGVYECACGAFYYGECCGAWREVDA